MVIQNGSNRSQSTSSGAHLWPHQCFVIIGGDGDGGVPSLSRVNDTFEFVECIKMEIVEYAADRSETLFISFIEFDPTYCAPVYFRPRQVTSDMYAKGSFRMRGICQC